MGGFTNVVPAYPYNVSMVPLTHNGPTPDDSGINTHLPSICVDYLSHDWAEDDVWASWKAMTRHKSEIANGVRLENASWRTWAKQRGNLKTISPETLNWLKDSDVTWLYGPLHTAVEAVPPPKIATASDRLGLEPLRSLSDAKPIRTNVPAGSPSVETVTPTPTSTSKRSKRPSLTTKPILKYRSLSDILMPPNGTIPGSPTLESPPVLDDTTHTPVPQTKSDSNLWRMHSGSRRHRVRLGSPSTSVRGSSPEKDLSVNSGYGSSGSKERRHISFNHRVEQCIAVDSTDEVKKYPYSASSASQAATASDDEDGDDEDDVLTFRSSPRVSSFGPVGLSAAHARQVPSTGDREPHTIARLGPTTLKSTEMYPAPSPVVVYQNTTLSPTEEGPPGRTYSHPVATYSSRPGSQPAGAGRRAMYDYSNSGTGPSSGGMHSSWDPDDDEDYAMGFDYFNGPDVGVGDEYDMAQYGSNHLVGTSHNNYQGGTTSPYLNASGTYTYGGGAVTAHQSAVSPTHSSSTSTSSESSPNHSRQSSNSPSASTSPSSPANAMRGPHSPATASKDAASPKRSILKGGPRSRENSATIDDSGPLLAAVAGKLGTGSPTFASPPSLPGSGQSTPVVPSSPQIGRVPLRRTISDEIRFERESRGRSASRGSSSSQERSASSDRRSSISPQASYASIVVGATSVRSGIAGSRRGGSSDSLNSLGTSQLAGARLMPDLPEASSESETETVKATVDDTEDEEDADAPTTESSSPPTSTSPPSSVDSTPSPGAAKVEDYLEKAVVPAVDGAQSVTRQPLRPSPVMVEPSSKALGIADGPKSPPLVPAPADPPPPTARAANIASPSLSPSPSRAYTRSPTSPPNHPSTSTAGPRYRQPSPSAPTTSVVDDAPSTSTLESRSLSNSPALDPADLASTPWSDETPVPSYARRSLLRAARGGSQSSSSGVPPSVAGPGERDESLSRGSVESGRSGGEDYGFGYYDEEGDAGLVGTARDLLGAITKGIWSIGRR